MSQHGQGPKPAPFNQAEASQFRLGLLPTEASHPETEQLSQIANSDLSRALQISKDVELGAIEQLKKYSPAIEGLQSEVAATLKAGSRIFIAGCGATGRLALSLEALVPSPAFASAATPKSVYAFIAGGDYAMVKSIENFEDHPEYGARQLRELGFREGDLLISCTEGGETPFVIGATFEALKISQRSPYFLFCNPKESLQGITRSEEIFANPRIISHGLFVGPMAICGSTRLQASSVLFFAGGLALFGALEIVNGQRPAPVLERIESYINFLRQNDLTQIKNLVELEYSTYKNDEFITYETTDYAFGLVTDLTERTPTFNLLAIENRFDQTPRPATASMHIPGAKTSSQAWQKILEHEPRALTWPELAAKYDLPVLLGFDFGDEGFNYRKKLIGSRPHHVVHIKRTGGALEIKGRGLKIVTQEPLSMLERQLWLKLIMNTSSTLAMCLLGRVDGNMMLFVKPSNKKLIDRAIRFSDKLLNQRYKLNVKYEELMQEVLKLKIQTKPDEAIVLKTVESIAAKYQKDLK